MPLVTVVMYLVIAGLVLWLINNYIPMDGKIRQIVNAVVVVAVVVWLLQVFGVMGPLSRIRVG
jgi:low temperature requirement protein LtrA